MAKSTTEKSKLSISAYLNAVENPERRKDVKLIYKWVKELTVLKPAMWGDSIIGFGTYHYRYASGREGDSFRIGLSARAQGMSIYLMSDFDGEAELMKKLGKHKMGRACLTFKRLSDLDTDVLKELIEKSSKGKICSEVEE